MPYQDSSDRELESTEMARPCMWFARIASQHLQRRPPQPARPTPAALAAYPSLTPTWALLPVILSDSLRFCTSVDSSVDCAILAAAKSRLLNFITPSHVTPPSHHPASQMQAFKLSVERERAVNPTPLPTLSFRRHCLPAILKHIKAQSI